MEANALSRQLRGPSPEFDPHKAFWTLRRRMFVQVFAALLPLIALSIYQTRLVGSIVTEMNARLSASQLSLQAANSFRNFLDGVTDAVDTGALGPKAVDAINRCATSLEQLQAQQPSEDVQAALASIAQIRAAVAVSTSIKTLMPLRGEINAASNAVKAAEISLAKAMAQQLARDDDLLNFRRSFVDAQAANLAIEAFHDLAALDAAAAEHLHRAVDDPLRRFRRRHLRHRRLARGRQALHVAPPRCAIGQKRRGVDVRRHLAECGLR